MSQLYILEVRLGGRPTEEWLSDTFLMDWEGGHTPKRERIAREGIVVETKKYKIMEMFLTIMIHIATSPTYPALLPSLVGMPLCMMTAANGMTAN